MVNTSLLKSRHDCSIKVFDIAKVKLFDERFVRNVFCSKKVQAKRNISYRIMCILRLSQFLIVIRVAVLRTDNTDNSN